MKGVKEKIEKVGEHREGVALPSEFLRHLELIPGAEVVVSLDKEKKAITIRSMSEEDFMEHFKESMETMA